VRLSPEARALVSPADVFRGLAGGRGGGAWLLARRPLALLLAMGSTVSILAGGRLTARLVVDGAISFAFIPIFEIAALAVVLRRIPRRVPLAQAVDVVFTANGPWILWMLAASTIASIAGPEELPRWTSRPRLYFVAAATAIAIAWFVRLELSAFRWALERTRREAISDVALHRALAWPAAAVYFFAFALWPMIVGMLRR